MFYKSRTEAKELKKLRILYLRMDLPLKDANNYHTLEKGFEGEKKFDDFLTKIPQNWLTLNDLQLESSGNTFQIDTTLLFQGIIHLINVKNYEGDYYIENDRWYTSSEKIIRNPLEQLNRSEDFFKQLLHKYGLKFSVESYLIFINPHFHLYNAPRDLPAFFPTQLNRYKDYVMSIPSNLTGRHIKFAKKLASLHLSESPYTRYPEYTYEMQKKGVTCVSCHSFITEFHKSVLVCNKCGYIEDVDSAVLRCVEELILLFPDRKITTNFVQEWCKIIPHKTIWRILSKTFRFTGHSSSFHYIKAPIIKE